MTTAQYKDHQETGHQIYFDHFKQISNIEHYRTRAIKEAIEIEKIVILNKTDDVLTD